MFAIGDTDWPGISKLVEELGEVAQVCGKLIGTGGVVDHWDGSNLRDRLRDELADLSAAIAFVIDTNGIGNAAVLSRAQQKLSLFKRWHADQTAAGLRDGQSQNHTNRNHPGWEYATTKTYRKGDDGVMPDGSGWVANHHVTSDGRNWARFDFHDEQYWMRPTGGRRGG